MTLTPEPRPARRPFTKYGYRPTRVESQDLEHAFSERRQAFADVTTHMQAAVAQITTAFNIFTIFALALRAGSPRARRRYRKQLRLIAHYQKKLDRIPTWKRTTNPEGTR